MQVGNVSFGNIVAVSGTQRSMRRFDEIMQRYQRNGKMHIIEQDLTSHYKKTSGLTHISNAIKQGKKIKVFMSSDDFKKNCDKDNYNSLLTKVKTFIDTDKFQPDMAIGKVLENSKEKI